MMQTATGFRMSSDSTGTSPQTLNGWYELFSRGSRDWLRHNEKIREAVRAASAADRRRRRTSSTTARAPCGCPCACSSIIASGCVQTGDAQGVGQGKAKPGDVLGPGQSASAARARKAPAARISGGIELMLEFKVDDIIDWLWEDLKLPNLQPRAGATEESEWKREGWDRRGARSRLDRRRSLKESVKRRALDADVAGIHRRGSALSAAHAPPPAGAARGGILSARRLGQHVATATGSWQRPSSSGWRPGCGASTRRSTSCSSPIPPRPGSSARRTSSRSPAAAAPWPPSGLAKVREIMHRALRSRAPATCTCSMRRTATTPRMTARPPPPSSRRSPRRRATPATWRSRPESRSSQSETMRSVRGRGRVGPALRALLRRAARTTSRRRCGISSPPRRNTSRRRRCRGSRPHEARTGAATSRSSRISRASSGSTGRRSSSRRCPTAS